MKQNKILLLVPDLKGGGGVTNLYNVLKLEADCDITYFAVNKPNPQSVIGAVCRLFVKYVSFFWQLVAYNYKIVHVNPSLYPRSFYRDAIFIIISKLLNRKVLISFHGWLEDYEDRIKRSFLKSLLFKVSYAQADKYIVLGEVFKRKLINMGVPNSTDFFIETTVADSRFLTELNLDAKLDSYRDSVIFLFLAEITRTKGIYIAIDAYKELFERYLERKFSLIVAGDGIELANVRNYVKENNIPNVIFTGYISELNKKDVLLKSHIILLPSYTEGLPSTILEGMLYGMPIISRVTGAIPDVIKQGINGFLSESFDASIFREFMHRLLIDHCLYQNIAKVNHEAALMKYSTEKVRSRVKEIYSTF